MNREEVVLRALADTVTKRVVTQIKPVANHVSVDIMPVAVAIADMQEAITKNIRDTPANVSVNVDNSEVARAIVEMTKAIISACQVLGIAVHDHVIIGKHGHRSFKDLKLM